MFHLTDPAIHLNASRYSQVLLIGEQYNKEVLSLVVEFAV